MRRSGSGGRPPGLGLLVATWNLGGCAPDPGAFRWPGTRGDGARQPLADFVCVASQEAHYRVPGGEPLVTRAAKAVGAFAGAAAAKTLGAGGVTCAFLTAAGYILARYAVAEARCRRHWLCTVESSLRSGDNEEYRLVAYACLIHMRVAVFARQWPPGVGGGLETTGVSVKRVPTGVLGVLGNKGGILVRLRLERKGEASQCKPEVLNFIAVHLAPHEQPRQKRLQEREAMLCKVLRACPGCSARPCEDPQFSDALATVLLGDLNYRVDSEGLPASAIAGRRWEELLRHDQLSALMKDGSLLQGFREGSLSFAPTYKLKRGKYVANRTPSWCDRILFLTPGGPGMLQIGEYCSPSGILGPWDHRPVFANCRLIPKC